MKSKVRFDPFIDIPAYPTLMASKRAAGTRAYRHGIHYPGDSR